MRTMRVAGVVRFVAFLMLIADSQSGSPDATAPTGLYHVMGERVSGGLLIPQVAVGV